MYPLAKVQVYNYSITYPSGDGIACIVFLSSTTLSRTFRLKLMHASQQTRGHGQGKQENMQAVSSYLQSPHLSMARIVGAELLQESNSLFSVTFNAERRKARIG
jgi:hypothetical protein